MDKIERIKALREELTQAVSEVKETVVADMTTIADQINDLVKQGVALAEASGVNFSLASLDFLPYGAGGLVYVPKGQGAGSDYYGDSEGWLSSSSSC